MIFFIQGLNTFVMYSKKVLAHIQPESDLPKHQSFGKLLAMTAGTRSYGYTTIGGAKTPAALPVANAVKFSFSSPDAVYTFFPPYGL